MDIKDYNSAVDQFSDGGYRFILKNIRNQEKAKDIRSGAACTGWAVGASVAALIFLIRTLAATKEQADALN